MSLNRLIALNPLQNNTVDSYQKGVAQGQNRIGRDLQNQSRELQNTSARNTLDRQSNVNRLLQQQAQSFEAPQQAVQSAPTGEPTQEQSAIAQQLKTLATPEETMQAKLFAANGDVDGMAKLTQSILGRGQPDPEFLKEERKTAAQDVRSFNNQAKEMRTSYGKLQGLANQARSGDRGARNAMTVAVGRLMSPGIFTETEASALSGGQNTLQGILAAFAGKGVDVAALQRNIDPYGDNFNVEGLLNIGSTIVASSRQPLIDMYEGSRNRATTSGMSERSFDTNFGDNTNYDFLKEFKQGAGGGQQAAQPAANTQMSDDEYAARKAKLGL